MKRLISGIMAGAMALSMGVNAFAEGQNDIAENEGSGTVPVVFTAEVTTFSVTVPTSLPVTMDKAGDVTVADDVVIKNNSYGAVRVKTADITAANGWKLCAFGEKETLASEKVDANKLGFSLQLGGGTEHGTVADAEDTQQLIEAPEDGCYMSGIGDSDNDHIAVVYDAIATPVSEAKSAANIANVVFVVEYDK